MKRVLIIRSGALGDSIVTLPVIGAIRKKWPSCRIEVIGSSPLTELVNGRYYADRVVSIDGSGFSNFFTEAAVLPENWMNYFKSFDLIVCFIKDDCLLRNLRSTGVGKIVSVVPEYDDGVHMVEYLLKQLGSLCVEADTVPRIFFSSEDMVSGNRFWEKHGLGSSLVVAVHPGSGSIKKSWPVERFRKVASWLMSKHNAKILIPCGEADMRITKKMIEGFSSADMIVVANYSLPELGAIFRRCALFLGNDSGLGHLASASGTCVVSIFGPTDPHVWAPKGKVTVVSRELPCSPCSREKMHSCESQKCLCGIEPEHVMEKIEKVLLET